MITAALVLAALAYLFWPSAAKQLPAAAELFTLPAAVTTPSPSPQATTQAAPDSRQAIDSLLAVRDRLAATSALDDQASAAVDTLWLDLLHGSQPK